MSFDSCLRLHDYASHPPWKDAESELVERCFRGRMHYYHNTFPERRALKEAKYQENERTRQYRRNVQFFIVIAMLFFLVARWFQPQHSSPLFEVSYRVLPTVLMLGSAALGVYDSMYSIP